MKTSPEVASIGTLAVDYFGILEEMPALDDKTMAVGYEVHPGGVAGNVITQIARLGVSTGWMGKIGDDGTGRILMDEFRKEGIDNRGAEVIPGKNSMFTWIMIDRSGHRTITMFPNVLNEFTGEDVREKHRDLITNAEVLMAEACVLPLEPDIAAMEIARESQTTVVFDLDVTPSGVELMKMGSRADLDRAIALTDVFIPCKAAATELLGTDDIVGNAHRLLDLGPSTVAVTLGEQGCIVLTREERHGVPGFAVDVVDSTGAGDAYHGGFVYGLLQGYPLAETARFANACGALNCRAIGARASAPLKDVESLLQSRP
jgi:sulfofructose kinase